MLAGERPMDMPLVTLRPMTDAELDVYRHWAVDNLAAQLARSRGISEPATRPAAQKQLDAVLPEGRPRAGEVFALSVLDDAGQRVGSILCGRQSDLGQPRLFLYDIVIGEAYRGRGLGRAAMVALEGFAASAGAGAIALNVFGHNQVARSLYESLGFAVQQVGMAKPIVK